MTRHRIAQFVRAFLLASLVIFCFGAAGEICGAFFETTAAAFDSKYPDNKIEDARPVLQALGAPETPTAPDNSAGKPIAVMLADGDPRTLVAWDLVGGQPLWKITPPVQSELTAEDNLLIFQSGYEVAGVDLSTGQELWRVEIEEGWDYYGSAVDGGLAFVAMGVGGHEPGAYSNGRLVALKAHSGNRKWDISSGGGLLGDPSAEDGYVFVPWDRQKIAVLLASEGEEKLRLRADDFTINYVRSGPAGVHYGSMPSGNNLPSLFHFDETSMTGTREGTNSFTPQLEPVPGDPGFKRDAFARPISGRSASEKIRFHWQPIAAPGQPIAFSDGLYYLHYWRYVIAFDAGTHRVRWTYRSSEDLESMDAVVGGVIGVDSNGRLFFVDAASGNEIWSQDTGMKVLTAVFDANGFRPAGGGGAPEDPLIGLGEILWDKDNRMMPIRSYAAFLMADIPKPEVTRDLLAVYSDAQVPKGLRDSVVQALKKRTTGSEYLVEALHMRYDFLEQTQAPPMGVVAPALVNMEERAAVPGLLSHLMNHETPVEDLREIAVAIDALGDPSVAGTLTQFLILYHADSSFIGHEDALAAVAQALLDHGGQAGKQAVAEIRDDPQTLPELQTMLRDILDPDAAAKAAARASEEARRKAEQEAQRKADAEAQSAAAAAAARPNSLTRDQINQTIAENQEVLKPCVQSALGRMPTLRQIRMKFVITGETGKASNLQILPANLPGLQQCLANGLASIEFPRFKNLRQPATYLIKIRGQAPPAGYTPPQPSGGQQPVYDPDSFGAPQPGGFQQQRPGGQQPQQPGGESDPDAFQ
jgi:outer membrane protein assembly factor BamB